MCVDPVTMMMVGGAVGAAGNLFAGFSAKQTADTNAAALENSAQQRAEKEKFDTERADNRFRRVQGAVIAKAGSTNIDLSSFSDVLADDAKESALEKQAIHVSSQIDQQNLRFQAAGQKAAGKTALISGIFNAAGSVVKAGTNIENDRMLDTKYGKLGGRGISIDDGIDPYK